MADEKDGSATGSGYDTDDIEQSMADQEAPCGSTPIAIPLGRKIEPTAQMASPQSRMTQAYLDHMAATGGHMAMHPGPQVPPAVAEHAAGHPGTMPAGHPGAMPAGHPGTMPAGHPGTMPAGHPGGHPAGVQREGGARSMGFRPGGGPAAQAYQERTGIKAPRIIAWEITRSCNLSCKHCRAAAEFGSYPGELSLDQIKATIDDIATITNPILILTGGEPLKRPDIWDIIDYAHEKGCMPVIGTNATLITDDIAAKMAEHGIPRISVSIDFPTAAEHDEFRGEKGAFDSSIAGIKLAQKHGVGVQVNMTVTAKNADKLEEMHQLCLDLGVDAFHIFLLVPTGRGTNLRDIELSPEGYEKALTWAYEKQKVSPLHFKPTDAPQYYRIIRQKAAEEGRKVTPEEYGMDALTRGCLGGITFCFISNTGDIQPCGYFDMQLGNVKEKPFSQIWTESPVFNDLRDFTKLKGKCGLCEYKGFCGGCRARALSATGDYLAEEPYCAYIPRRMRGEGEADGTVEVSVEGASSGDVAGNSAAGAPHKGRQA